MRFTDKDKFLLRDGKTGELREVLPLVFLDGSDTPSGLLELVDTDAGYVHQLEYTQEGHKLGTKVTKGVVTVIFVE